MHAYSMVSRGARLIFGAGLGLALPLAGLAVDRTSGATLTVTVLADRYVAADVAFADLDALDALVQPVNPTVLQLDGCGRASANALLAAVERYGKRYLEIRVLADAERPCAAAAAIDGAVRVTQATGAVPVRGAYFLSEGYWRNVMP